MNFSSALKPHAIQRAFEARARVLAPDRNPACLARAGREYISARRARDTLLLLASLSIDATNAQPKKKKEHPVRPLSMSPGRWRAMRRRPRKQSKSLGTQITLILAIKLAIYRLLRDYKTKFVRGWWRRAGRFVGDVLHFGRRAFGSLVSLFSAHRTVLLVTLVSLAIMPAITLA